MFRVWGVLISGVRLRRLAIKGLGLGGWAVEVWGSACAALVRVARGVFGIWG
jgi:hypothetical protein